MTRLKTEWIFDIEDGILECEKYLYEKTGKTFKTLIDEKEWIREEIKVGVVPVTQGVGIIECFSSSVAAIIRGMSIDAFVTENTDVAGIYEAYSKGANIIFMADDLKFIAFNRYSGKIVDNIDATAIGYVKALEAYCKDLNDKQLLLIGYGNMGKIIYGILKEKGSLVTLMENNPSKLKELKAIGANTIENISEIKKFKYIIDTSNTGSWITENTIDKEAFIVSPGVPMSLDEKAYKECEGRIIHDYLQIGVASMMRMVIDSREFI